jgi:hypothetical protein
LGEGDWRSEQQGGDDRRDGGGLHEVGFGLLGKRVGRSGRGCRAERVARQGAKRKAAECGTKDDHLDAGSYEA